MKEEIINISQLLESTDIRSRFNAKIIYAAIDGVQENVILDFFGIKFMSRSFADELYNLLSTHQNVTARNMSNDVSDMYNIVSRSRNSRRQRSVDDTTEIVTAKDMKSLAEIFSAF